MDQNFQCVLFVSSRGIGQLQYGIHHFACRELNAGGGDGNLLAGREWATAKLP